MTFGLENDCLTVINVNDTSTFTRPLQNPVILVGEQSQHWLGLFVGTVLGPHCRVKARFRVVWQTVQQLFADVVIFFFRQTPVEIWFLFLNFFRGHCLLHSNYASVLTVPFSNKDLNSRKPSVEPKSASTARSGWGIMPNTLPRLLTIPAMLRKEPLGFSLA